MKPVHGSGPLDAKLGVLGESPGRNEEIEGAPFVGASGAFLFEGLRMQRDQVRLLNVRTYRPDEEESASERAEGIAACRPGLEEQISRLTQAEVLLLVGADALEAVVGVAGPLKHPETKKRMFPGITEYHGSQWTRVEVDAIRAATAAAGVQVVQSLPRSVRVVVATYHPAFAMHGQPQFKPWIRTVIGRAAAWCNSGGNPWRPAEECFDLQATPAAFEAAVAAADAQGLPIAFDIETQEGDGTAITLVGICVGARVYVCRFDAALREVLRRVFARRGIFVGHNLAFDFKGLAAWDIGPGTDDATQWARLSVDTMIGASLLWPPFEGSKQARWLSLAGTCSRLLNGYAYHKQPKNPATRAWMRAVWPGVPEFLLPQLYNGLDVWYNGAPGIWPPMRALLQQRGML